MLGGIRDPEADDHDVEKARIVERRALRREVIADVKLELPFARLERIALEERRITAARSRLVAIFFTALRVAPASEASSSVMPAAGRPRVRSRTCVVRRPMLNSGSLASRQP